MKTTKRFEELEIAISENLEINGTEPQVDIEIEKLNKKLALELEEIYNKCCNKYNEYFSGKNREVGF